MPQTEDDLVEQIYAAALDPVLWPKLMESLADSIGASAGVMTRLSMTTGLGESIPFRVDEERLKAYQEYYYQKNVFTLVDDVAAYRRGWRLGVLSTGDCLPIEDYQRSEYFNDFMRPQNVGATLHIRLDIDDTTSAAIAMGRPLHAGEFEAAGWERATRLQPHLVRAYKLTRGLALRLGPERDLARAVEGSSHAVFLVDGGGAIRHANAAAEGLLVSSGGLMAMGGRLTSRNSDYARQLDRLMAAAAPMHGQAVAGAMRIPQAGQRFPLAVRVAPIPRPPSLLFGHPRTALVFVTDLELEIRSPEDELRQLFGLTYAEARVATAIFDGLSMREAADRLEVALNTVRFQLARVYEKTGVTRQAELVKLMMRLAGGMADDPGRRRG